MTLAAAPILGGPIGQEVVVIGGGAAGLMCAIEAGKRGRSVLVLEHGARVGNKILISGGGRCNFTNIDAGPDNYFSANPHFCRSALARYRPSDFIALVQEHGIPFHERSLGQLFCNSSSRQIVEMLQRECAANGVRTLLNCRVEEVGKERRFHLRTNEGPLECDSLVVATGGLSMPRIGASDFGYRIAAQFGLKLVPRYPALTPLLFGAADRAAYGGLSGISLEVVASFGRHRFREMMLFTHHGLSGPAILQISSCCPEGGTILLDLLPDKPALGLLAAARRTNRELATVLSEVLPRRFVHQWCERCAPSRPLNQYSEQELASISQQLHAWAVTPGGAEGYAKAEVTLGGVDTSELSSRTMEASKVPGLFFIGEVVDVTGWLGGYNFQWAWASGHAAGQVV